MTGREILTVVASPTAEQVHLRVPARQSYAPIVKVAAVALAKRLDTSFADLADLRLVVDQAMFMLLDGLRTDRNEDLHIDVVFRVVEARFELEANRNAGVGLSDRAVRFFTDITRGLVDELRIDGDIGAIRLSKSLVGVR